MMAAQITVALDLTAFKDELLHGIQVAVRKQIGEALEEFHTLLLEVCFSHTLHKNLDREIDLASKATHHRGFSYNLL